MDRDVLSKQISKTKFNPESTSVNYFYWFTMKMVHLDQQLRKCVNSQKQNFSR